MRKRIFALLLAATLLAGSHGVSFAGEYDDQPMQPGYGNCGPGRGFGHGPSMRHRGPGNDRRGGGRQDFDGRRQGFGGGHHGFGGGRNWGGGGRPGFGGPMFGQRLFDRLDLDKAQRDKLVEVMTENFRAGLVARLEMREAENKLADLRESDSASPEDIVAANEALGAAAGKMEVARRKAREAVEAVLTPEQREQLDSFRDDSPRNRDRFDNDRRDRRDRDRDRDERPGRGGRGDRRGPGGPGRDASSSPRG